MNKDNPPKTWFKWVVPVLIIGGLPLAFILSSKGESAGKQLYGLHCSNCHMENGEGLKGLIPPFAGTSYLNQFRDQIPCILQNGLNGPIEVDGISYNQPMPANERLSPTDIANIINFIGNEWGNQSPYITPDSVNFYLKNCD